MFRRLSLRNTSALFSQSLLSLISTTLKLETFLEKNVYAATMPKTLIRYFGPQYAKIIVLRRENSSNTGPMKPRMKR